ncbi:MAG: YqgE/AlgH family protein [Alphaproteobacteria bacterium]
MLYPDDMQDNYLTGKLLVAMPYITDLRFVQAVIYVCGHDEKGAMGIVINRPLHTLRFSELLQQLDIDYPEDYVDVPMHQGGPMEVGRGFVLHTSDYITESTVLMSGGLALTATLDVLRAISVGGGPNQAILALGYVGWQPGQLEKEYQNNSWISIDATSDLVFNENLDEKWRLSMASLGIDPKVLSLDAGHS